MVRLLVAKGANIDTYAEVGSSPLQSAIEHQNFGIAKFLIQAGADCNLDTAEFGNALQQAVLQRAELEVIYLLLDKGATRDSILGPYKSALEAATTIGDGTILQELYARLPSKLYEGENASRVTQQAILSDQIDALGFFLECGAPADAYDACGWNPTVCAEIYSLVNGFVWQASLICRGYKWLSSAKIVAHEGYYLLIRENPFSISMENSVLETTVPSRYCKLA